MTDKQTVFADDEYLTRDDVCERLRISRRTLWEWESKSICPPRIKVGGAVRYPKSLFNQFINDHIQVGG